MTSAETEEKQPTVLEQMGGVSGMLYSSLPVVVFVIVNFAAKNLMAAIISALAAAVVIGVILAVRKGTVQPAISAVLGVGVAAFIAYRTGEAKDFFLFGIWQSVVYGSAFLLSIIVRWPLAGVLWTFLNGRDRSWRADKATVRDYDIATFVWALVFFARFVVQRWLYEGDQVGWLAVARLAMGYPLMAVALLATVWAVRRADKRLKEAEEAAAAEAEAQEVLARTADDLLTPDMDELQRVVDAESRDKSRD
ncbi:DUF3159 domain-containing protein [Lentzea sp. NPDC004782]|uniref:DUF3159 domain-containing protein n=1 Tax=Lentzea sp. NPDC004782 TaxID=3154458 RepID=UPI0033A003F0